MNLICSFCRKPESAVAKLISGPSGQPRVYICDECVDVCAMVIETERADHRSADERTPEGPHPLASHPLAPRLFSAVERWIRRESLGADAADDIAEVRSLARQMMAEPR